MATTILVLFVTLWAVIFVHEFGHLYAMRECGIPVKKMLVGIGPSVSLKNEWLRKKFGKDFFFSFGLLPLAGSVVAEESKDAEHGSYENVTYIAGAGPLINILTCLFTLGLLSLVRLVSGHSPHFAVTLFATDLHLSSWQLPLFLIGTAILGWRFRRFVCGYIFPVIAIVLLVQVGIAFSSHWQQAWESGNIASIAKDAGKVEDGLSLVKFWIYLNFVLGLSNLIPLYPLDGGHIVGRLLETFFKGGAKALRFAGMTLLALLMAFCISSDLWIMFK